MALKNINPTKTEAWKNLETHYEKAKHYNLRQLFQEDEERGKGFVYKFGDFNIDLSKNLFLI